MPRSLADGRTKFTILTTKPANPAAPTAAELNAGIDLSCNILASDFTFGAGDSEKVAEKALCTINNANALGASNFTAGVTVFRAVNKTTGAIDPTEDAPFAALKTKGTQVWGYARRTGKLATAAWATGDEAFLGADLLTDEPQPPGDLGGYIKYRVPMEVQDAWPFIAVAAGA
ncbi:MAG TPA: hypothetical protein VF642_12275 [Propionibacteriaceae bacterium]|jgi:hypothetical protein